MGGYPHQITLCQLVFVKRRVQKPARINVALITAVVNACWHQRSGACLNTSNNLVVVRRRNFYILSSGIWNRHPIG